MEYMIQQVQLLNQLGWLLETPTSNSTGQVSDASSVGFGKYIPKFTIQNAYFDNLKTWYGNNGSAKAVASGTSAYGTQPANWFNLYVNPTSNLAATNINYASMTTEKSNSNVSNIGVQGYSTTATATNVGAGINYGVNVTGTIFDF